MFDKSLADCASWYVCFGLGPSNSSIFLMLDARMSGESIDTDVAKFIGIMIASLIAMTFWGYHWYRVFFGSYSSSPGVLHEGLLRVKMVRTAAFLNLLCYEDWLQQTLGNCSVFGVHYRHIADLIALDQCRPTVCPLAATDGSCKESEAISSRAPMWGSGY